MSPLAFSHVPPGIHLSYLNDTESVYFDPSLLNTELWAPKTPRIVKVRCAGNKTLIAVWEAIHWLMVKHSAVGRRDFGYREIAEEARVSVSRLSGKNGYIQQLIDLGLLEVVGHQHVVGAISPRNVYRINMAQLEQLSYELVLGMMRGREIAPPPKPVPAEQTTMFDMFSDELIIPTGHSDLCPWEPAPCPEEHSPAGAQADLAPMCPDEHSNPDGKQSDPVSCSRPATAPYPDEHRRSQPATGAYSTGNGCARPATAACPDEHVLTYLETNQEKERETSDAPPHEKIGEDSGAATIKAMFAELSEQIRAELHATKEQLLEQAGSPASPADLPPPPAPDSEYPLPAHPLDIWSAERDLTRKERLMVEDLINRFDPLTGGFGAYWVGRAMFAAEGSIEAKGTSGPVTLPYVKGILRRWADKDTWGQDYFNGMLPGASFVEPVGERHHENGVDAPAPVVSAAPVVPAAPVADVVRIYEDAIGQAAGEEQRRLIEENVTDLSVWKEIVTEWKDESWKMRSVPAVKKMLDRYSKSTGERTTVEEDSLSDMIIEEYRDLIGFDEYQEWVGKAANTRHEPLQHQRILRRFLHMVKQRQEQHNV